MYEKQRKFCVSFLPEERWSRPECDWDPEGPATSHSSCCSWRLRRRRWRRSLSKSSSEEDVEFFTGVVSDNLVSRSFLEPLIIKDYEIRKNKKAILAWITYQRNAFLVPTVVGIPRVRQHSTLLAALDGLDGVDGYLSQSLHRTRTKLSHLKMNQTMSPALNVCLWMCMY